MIAPALGTAPCQYAHVLAARPRPKVLAVVAGQEWSRHERTVRVVRVDGEWCEVEHAGSWARRDRISVAELLSAWTLDGRVL